MEKWLCVRKSSIRELLIREAYEGGLICHFTEHKTYETLHEHFYWPRMRMNVHHVCEKCLVCKMAKSKASSNGLYISLPISTSPWVDISMNFVLGLSRSRGGRDSIFVVVDRFSKMTYFIPCHKSNYACRMANMFFKEVVSGEQNFVPTLKEKWLPNIDFAYNTVVNETMSHTSFELVYGFNTLSPLDLVPLLMESITDLDSLS
ncbi:hypothetical protein CR513_17916, partial [Mucuna pruriens]